MILGKVRDGAPLVQLEMHGREERMRFECVVDTGFDGQLAVPPDIMSKLDAAFRGERWVLMADRTPRLTAYYAIRIEWHGAVRTVEADLLDGRPLIGYELMEGDHLTVELIPGGEVALEPLE